MTARLKQAPPERIAERARAIAATCRDARRAKKVTMRALADAARLSVRMLVRMENGAHLARALMTAETSSRQTIELARQLSRVAAALDLDPSVWIANSGMTIAESDLRRILEQAHNRSTEGLRDALGPLKEIQQRATGGTRRSSSLQGEVRWSCGVVPYGPFAEGPPTAQSFLCRITEMIVGSISPDVSVEFFSAQNFRAELRSAKHDIVVGYLAQLQREYGLGLWQFAGIPGFRIRMSFLTTPGVSERLGNDWRALLWDRRRPSVSDVRLVTMASSVADNFVRGVLQRTATAEHRLQVSPIEPDYDNQLITRQVAAEFRRSDSACVFVTDQVTADVVRVGLDIDLRDLADSSPVGVPSYQLGIATRSTYAGTPLGEPFRRILREELFDAHAAVVADLYAAYLVRAIGASAALRESLQAVAYREAQHAPPPLLPSYLRVLQETPDWSLQQPFIDELREALNERLSRLYRGAPGIPDLTSMFIEQRPYDLGRAVPSSY